MRDRIPVITALSAAALLVAAALAIDVDRLGGDDDIAAPGAVLYQRAAEESVRSLAEGPGAQSRAAPPAAAPGQPCPHCGKIHPVAGDPSTPHVHAPQQGGATPVPAGPVPRPQPERRERVIGAHAGPLDGSVCPVCGKVHPVPEPRAPDPSAAHGRAATVARPPAGAEADYYFCTHCNAYHRRPVRKLDLPGFEPGLPSRDGE